jgi:hypothetical protein
MRLALPRVDCPLGRSAIHLGNLTGDYSLRESFKGYIVKPCLFTLVVSKGLIAQGKRESRLVVKVCNLCIVL